VGERSAVDWPGLRGLTSARTVDLKPSADRRAALKDALADQALFAGRGVIDRVDAGGEIGLDGHGEIRYY